MLDRLAVPVKLRFDGSEEIFALSPDAATPDATDLRRDDHTSILRIYNSGRVLAFSRKFPDGSTEAYRDQSAEPLAIPSASKPQASARALALSQKLKRASGITLKVGLDAPHLGEVSADWSAMADAVTVVGIALGELLDSPIAQNVISAKLQNVIIRDTGRTDIRLFDRTLIIEIAADKPILGRPSSARLKSAISDLL